VRALVVGAKGKQAPPGGVQAAEVVAQPVVQRTVAEHVMSGRHRRVGREHGAGGDHLQRRAEGHAGGDQLADALEARKGRVAFVQVPHRRPQPQPADRAHRADAEHDLLEQPRVLVAAIETRGDPAVFRRVLRAIGVEQEQWHPPDLGPPHPNLEHVVGQRHRDAQLSAEHVAHQLQLVRRRIQRIRIGVLLAVGVEVLAEVAVAIE
jgi:hypothetical protein